MKRMRWLRVGMAVTSNELRLSRVTRCKRAAAASRSAQLASHGIEMAVKDTSRVPEGWAYYNFGGSMMGGLRSSAAPSPKASC